MRTQVLTGFTLQNHTLDIFKCKNSSELDTKNTAMDLFTRPLLRLPNVNVKFLMKIWDNAHFSSYTLFFI